MDDASVATLVSRPQCGCGLRSPGANDPLPQLEAPHAWANSEPAVAFYVGPDAESSHEAWSITVLGLRGVVRDAQWAASICGISSDRIAQFARQLAGKRVLVTVAHALQRAEHGEQPVWLGLVLAAALGQPGLPGGGFTYALGALGHYATYRAGGSLLDDYPDLPERCPPSGPFAYRAGDATVHSVMLAHSASENRTDTPRWAWLVMTNPADARWTGAPPEAYDTTGMRHLQLLDDEARFPLIA